MDLNAKRQDLNKGNYKKGFKYFMQKRAMKVWKA